MITNQTLQVIITDVEHQDDETGYTRAWIAPANADPAADLEIEAVDHIDVPATEDEAEWYQGLRDELAHAGYAVLGAITQDGAVLTATVARA